ncbi:heparinase II/III family protein [Candidatus Hydrogenedentota bacterium]
MSIIKTIRTIRHLKTSQVTGQIRNRLRPFWENPGRCLQTPVPDSEVCHWRSDTSFLAPGVQGNAAESIREGHFSFLNREESIGWPPADWDISEFPKLWQYNLHYFEWLWALDYELVREGILDWLARHTLAKGRVGWEPYPTSLRLMNWCGVCFGKFREEIEADEDFARELWRSIFVQTKWLCKHLETHLLGNHLFENGAALAFVGSCFSGKAGQDWLNKGLEILKTEVSEQILPDGMHFERSPMYHVRMTYLLRLLRETGSEELKKLVEAPLAQMRTALAHLCHPDGQIALFNDSAFSIYNEPSDLLDPELTMAPGPWALPDAGYYGFRSTEGSYIICDAGPIGPDYIPGHSHGDLFSFELSLKGQRVIVDSGVYDYVPDEMRRYCRSTGAHNTVEIEEQDQCEFWSAFRVARRGYPRDVQWEQTLDGFRLSSWHDGYQRLPGRPTHHRTLVWDSSKGLEVRDRIKARRTVNAVSRLHLHPACRIMRSGERDALVEYPEGGFQVTFTGQGELFREESFYCPEFGRKESNVVLAFKFNGKEAETAFNIVSQ